MWATQLLMLVPQVILVPYLIGTIGEVGYGVYALVWALMVSIDQLEKSLQSGVVKYSAAYLAQGLNDEVNKIISSSFVYSLFLAVLACIGIFVAAAFYNDPSGQIGTALFIVGIMLLFIVPLTPYIAVIQSMQRYYVGAIADTLSRYISLLVVVIWFGMVRPSVEALIVITAVMLFFSRLVQVPIAYHFVPGLQINTRLFDKESFRLIAAFGAATVLASACLAMNTTGVRWLMDALVSTRFVAHLAIMLMPAMLLSQIISAMTITVMPATSACVATGNQRMLQELLIRGMRYTTIMALAGLFAAGLLMRDVLNIWVGPNYVFLAPYVLVLFVTRSFMLSTSTAHHMLKGMGKLRAVVLIYLVALVIVPFGLILIIFQIWREPYVAVTVGLAAGYVVCGCLQIGFSFKAVSADLRSVLMRAYMQPLICAAAVCLASLCIMTFLGFDGFLARIIISIITVLLFLGSAYFVIATAAERQQLEELIKLTLNKIASILITNSVHRKK
jgi:O-antigen/teichoic acid export membrane protein